MAVNFNQVTHSFWWKATTHRQGSVSMFYCISCVSWCYPLIWLTPYTYWFFRVSQFEFVFVSPVTWSQNVCGMLTYFLANRSLFLIFAFRRRGFFFLKKKLHKLRSYKRLRVVHSEADKLNTSFIILLLISGSAVIAKSRIKSGRIARYECINNEW